METCQNGKMGIENYHSKAIINKKDLTSNETFVHISMADLSRSKINGRKRYLMIKDSEDHYHTHYLDQSALRKGRKGTSFDLSVLPAFVYARPVSPTDLISEEEKMMRVKLFNPFSSSLYSDNESSTTS